MPPSRSLSLEDLIEVLRRVADSQLTLSASSNRLATAQERLLPAFEQLRHNVADVLDKRELDTAKLNLDMSKISTDLALLIDNVRHAQTDVRELQRDVTGAFKIPPEDKRHTVERVIDRFERLKLSTKLLIVILVVIAGASGWLTHLLAG